MEVLEGWPPPLPSPHCCWAASSRSSSAAPLRRAPGSPPTTKPSAVMHPSLPSFSTASSTAQRVPSRPACTCSTPLLRFVHAIASVRRYLLANPIGAFLGMLVLEFRSFVDECREFCSLSKTLVTTGYCFWKFQNSVSFLL